MDYVQVEWMAMEIKNGLASAGLIFADVDGPACILLTYT